MTCCHTLFEERANFRRQMLTAVAEDASPVALVLSFR